MDQILYFPYIAIPATPWLARALLYWDKIGSIVPFEYLHNPEALGPYMRDLVEAGLVEQIFPEDHIHKIPKFREAFIDFVDNNKWTRGRSREISRQAERRGRPNQLLGHSQPIHSSKLGGRSFSHGHWMGNDRAKQIVPSTMPFAIHNSKLGGLVQELELRGLARVTNPPWVEFDGYTAHHFMSYLAILIGSVTNYQPATDGYAGLADLIDNPPLPRHVSQIRDRLRAQVLSDVLPSPAHIGDISTLVKIKEKHGKQLVRFRRYIEDFLSRLEVAKSEEANEMTARFQAEVKEEMEELSARMKEKGWRSIGLTTICSVASKLLPFADAVKRNQKRELLMAIPGIISAIGSALSQAQIGSERRHPLAYALITQKAFPLKRSDRSMLDPFIGSGTVRKS